DRLPGLVVPHDGGLALVGDADAHDVLERRARLVHRTAQRLALRAEDLLRVVLDPAGLRKDLLELALRSGDGHAVLVEEDGARAGGALIQRKDVTHGKV